MLSMTEIRAGLAANITDNVSGVQVSAWKLADTTPPCAQITPDDPFLEYDLTGSRGSDKWTFLVELYVSENFADGDQAALDALIDEMKDAIESDRTLGGACGDLRVTQAGGYGEQVEGQNRVVGCRFTVEVYG